MDAPTREQAIRIAQDLINGKIEPRKVAEWAQPFYYPENRSTLQKLEEDDPLLEEFISTLGMADLPGTDDNKVYGVRDFQQWLDEFLEVTDLSKS